LARCEQQLAEGAFGEPLDAEQVRRVVNMEQIVGGVQTADSDLARRAAAVRRQIEPWVARKNAIVAGGSAATEGGADNGGSGAEAEARAEQPASLAGKRQGTAGGRERELQSQRATHGELTTELAAMAGVLKANSRALGGLVAGDRALVEETAAALEGSVSGLGRQGARVGAYRRRAWGTAGMTWLAVAVVVSVFLVVVLFIKVVPKRY
ncbi:hypothetical protein H4R19_005657, partial [Coemansia spiralis]